MSIRSKRDMEYERRQLERQFVMCPDCGKHIGRGTTIIYIDGMIYCGSCGSKRR